MAEPGQRRKLEAILSADVVGYSRLMQDDDAATVETLTKYRAIFSDFANRHEGRIVDSPGDNILAEFDSPVEAVQCAVELQREFARRNLQLADHRQMQFRIGINLGDILSRDDGTIYGDGVNVAARLESLAEPGGIMISESARMQVRSLIDVSIADAGEHEVKNISEPVHAYRIVLDESAPKPKMQRKVPRAMIAITAVAVLVIAIVVGLGFRPGGEPQDPILALPDGPSIAVLPFDNLSGDPEQEYFSDGLVEDIITGLSLFPDLFVIARNSTFQYKGKAVDVRQVGTELGVRYVLQGSVRRSVERIRVAVQLLNAKDGSHLWAETYDRDLTATDIFDLQDEIQGRVVATIADAYGIIARPALQVASSKGTDNLEAYECVLYTYHYYMYLTPDKHLVARECLERTIELDPNYSEAWAWLAQVYLEEQMFGFNPRPDSVKRGLETAQRAVEIDPRNSNAHFALAAAHFFLHDLDKFHEEADRTLTLNPANSIALGNFGLWTVFSGAWERGISLTEKAAALNPVYPGWYYLSYFYPHYFRGEYGKALAEAKNVNMPGFYWYHIVLAAAHAQLGHVNEASAAVASLQEVYPGFTIETLAEELPLWNFPEKDQAHMLDGLRKAGLNMREELTAAD